VHNNPKKVAGLGHPILSHFYIFFNSLRRLRAGVMQHFCGKVGRPNPASFSVV